MLKQNVAIKVNTFVKLVLHKSFILQVLLYGFKCLTAGRTEIQILEKLRKCSQMDNGKSRYRIQIHLRLLNLLPLQMFIQLNDLLLVSKASNEENRGFELPEVDTKETMNNEIFKMTKTRTEKAPIEFTFETCRIANHLETSINLREPGGLEKPNITYNMEFFREIFWAKYLHFAIVLRLPKL